MIGVAAFLLTSAMRIFACPLELQIDHLGGQRYLVDVQRNSTKPPNRAVEATYKLNAQTH
jgi:hypothetical protein